MFILFTLFAVIISTLTCDLSTKSTKTGPSTGLW